MPIPNKDELQLIGKYVIGLYRLKYFVVAGYVASNTLESIINFFLRQQKNYDIDSNIHISLDEKIKAISIPYLNAKYSLNINFGKLIELKNTRNDIIHGFIRNLNPKEIKEIVKFIWEVVTVVTESDAEKNIDLIDVKTAQYWVRDFESSIEKRNIPRPSNDLQIVHADFQDLYKMRNKFLELTTFLDTRKRLGQYPNFTVDDLSAVNTTSAYVWLAIVDRRGEPRRKIKGASISLLATPLDLRIYLDFGGLAFQHRKNYLKFLQTDKIESSIINFNDLFIFDIDWYSFISEKHPFKKYVKNPEFKRKAKQYCDIVENSNPEVPLTWNKLLIGYIIDRKSTEDDSLKFEKIWEKICSIFKLYEMYHSSTGIEGSKPNIAPMSKLTELQNLFNH